MKKLVAAIMITCFSAPLNAQEQEQVHFTNLKFLSTINPKEKTTFRYEVYMLPNQTYGYVIFANDEKYLHQANMPGKPLSVGFSSKEAASKVAGLVIERLERPIMPPHVSMAEMQYLGVN